MTDFIATYTPMVVAFAGNLLLAIIILFVGLKLIKFFDKFIKKNLANKDFDPSLVRFMVSMVSTILKILLIISALSIIGIETTSFIALIGAAGIAIGAALSGTLQNFASGVMIMFFKPFSVDDVIETQGEKGQVKAIQIFNTILITPNGLKIVVPNAKITSDIIKNHSSEQLRRVDMTFKVNYESDIKKVKDVIKKVVTTHPLVSPLQEPVIEVVNISEGGNEFLVGPWVEPVNYIEVETTLSEKIKDAFDNNSISIARPAQDVYHHN